MVEVNLLSWKIVAASVAYVGIDGSLYRAKLSKANIM